MLDRFLQFAPSGNVLGNTGQEIIGEHSLRGFSPSQIHRLRRRTRVARASVAWLNVMLGENAPLTDNLRLYFEAERYTVSDRLRTLIRAFERKPVGYAI